MKRVVFNNFKPKQILESLEKIKYEESITVSTPRLHMYIKKIMKGGTLPERKLLKVFLGIDIVSDFIKEDIEKAKFYTNLIGIFNKLEEVNSIKWIYAMKNTLFFTYKELYYHNELKKAYLNKMEKNIGFDSLSNQNIYQYIHSNFNMEEYYINRIYTIFIETNQGFDSIYEELGIETTSSFYYSTIIKIIEYNLLDVVFEKKKISYSQEFIKVMNSSFSIKDKNIIFKKLLNNYHNKKVSPRNYSSIWFNYMLAENGRLTSDRWNRYSELEKSIFKKWQNYKNIKDFFEKYAIHPDRKDYWYKWMNIIEESVIIEEFHQALVMEFADHLIVEFGEVGAVRAYSKEILSIRKINLLFNNYTKTRAREIIRDEYEEDINSRWKHLGEWKWTFDYNMSKLGYRK